VAHGVGDGERPAVWWGEGRQVVDGQDGDDVAPAQRRVAVGQRPQLTRDRDAIAGLEQPQPHGRTRAARDQPDVVVAWRRAAAPVDARQAELAAGGEARAVGIVDELSGRADRALRPGEGVERRPAPHRVGMGHGRGPQAAAREHRCGRADGSARDGHEGRGQASRE
jgi:hypothetical protein